MILTDSELWSQPERNPVVAQFENTGNPKKSGVILSAAVLQAERRISQPPTPCYLRSLFPLVKTRAFGMTPRIAAESSNRATTRNRAGLSSRSLRTTLRSLR
jgi:hypothetical protein